MTEELLRKLLQPFVVLPTIAPVPPLPSDIYAKLRTYLELLLRWNSRTNLTSIREPEGIVTRHFGEGLFCALQLQLHLGPHATLLDFGSGAGFPGIPIQLAIPSLAVTLAESQSKKAAFLREAVRVLGLDTVVWAGRVETLPRGRLFSAITLRAVDRMEDARVSAAERLLSGGLFVELSSESSPAPKGFELLVPALPLPGSNHRELRLWITTRSQ